MRQQKALQSLFYHVLISKLMTSFLFIMSDYFLPCMQFEFISIPRMSNHRVSALQFDNYRPERMAPALVIEAVEFG